MSKELLDLPLVLQLWELKQSVKSNLLIIFSQHSIRLSMKLLNIDIEVEICLIVSNIWIIVFMRYKIIGNLRDFIT